MKDQKKKYLVLLLLVMAIIRVNGQIPDFSTVPNVYEGDSVGIANLINNGTMLQKGRVIAWFPKDSLSAKRMNEILDTLNIGVIATEKFMKAPRPWQVHHKDQPFIFYFRPESFVSHASAAGFVSVPFWRIKLGNSPWLHEVLHEMLNPKAGNWFNESIPDDVWVKNMPLWLSEGLPEYISLQVSKQHNLRHFDVFSNSFRTDVDSMCAEDLKGSKGDSILLYIGKRGALTGLFGNNRRLYAPAFYHCSCSFVKYLAERHGVDPLIESHAGYPREIEELEKRLGSSMDKLKKSWLIKIKKK